MNDRRFDGIPLILETPESERWSEEIRLLYALIDRERIPQVPPCRRR
jgi:endonuclease IV